MARRTEYLIETDIILDHLTQNDNNLPSLLETAMTKGICYTSVITASEIYFHVKNETERQMVDSVFFALRVLGIHPRYSLYISEFFNKVATVRDALVCSLAKFNKLPILTSEVSRFESSGIVIITPYELRG